MLIAAFPKEIPDYQYYLEEPGEVSKSRCIDNSVTSRSKCCGYCSCEQHPGYLTVKLMRVHECIEKECSFFYRIVKNDKKGINPVIWSMSDKSDVKDERVLSKAGNLTKNYEGLRILKASKDPEGIWCLYYISISNYNYEEISKMLKQKLGVEIKLIKMNLSFEEMVEIIMNE